MMRAWSAAALLVLFALASGAWAAPPKFHGLKVLPPEQLPDLELTDHALRRFSLRAQRGRVVVLTFGYTRCADVCPTTMVMFRDAERSLGPQASAVRFVFVTTDPVRDSAQRLGHYVALFSPRFLGLSGSLPALARAYEAFGVVPVRYTAAGGPTNDKVSHPAAAYLVDPAGVLRLTYAWGMQAPSLAADIRRVLSGF
jgi:protein SCO1/2